MCEGNIIGVLNKLDGVKKVKINDKTTLVHLETAISKAGYQANDIAADPESYGKVPLFCKLQKTEINGATE